MRWPLLYKGDFNMIRFSSERNRKGSISDSLVNEIGKVVYRMV